MLVYSIIISLICLTECYIIFNLYKKYNKLEDINESVTKQAEEDSAFIMSIRSRVMSQKSYLRQLDKNGSFESDDEVGYFFKELKKIINDISIYFEIENEDNEPAKNSNIRSVISRRL